MASSIPRVPNSHGGTTLGALLRAGVGLVRRHGAGLARAGGVPALALAALTPAAGAVAAGWPWGVALAADLASMVAGWAVLGLFQAVCYRAFLDGQVRPGWLAAARPDAGARRLAGTFLVLCLVSMAPSVLAAGGWYVLSRSHNTVYLLAALAPATVLGILLYFRLVLALPAALEDDTGQSMGSRLSQAWRRGRGRAGRLFLASLLLNLPLIAVVAAVQLAVQGIPGMAPTRALWDLLAAPVELASAALISALVAAVHRRARG